MATADSKETVARIYEKSGVTDSYLDKRLKFSWQRYQHSKQVASLNAIIREFAPRHILEVAPGPARLATDLVGVHSGRMVENSPGMVAIANERLVEAGKSHLWDVTLGDAFDLGAVIGEERYQMAFTFRLIRHFRRKERSLLYKEIADCLIDSGLLVFDVVDEVTRNREDKISGGRAPGNIDIYDVTYSKTKFIEEMRQNGFDVLRMVPVLQHFSLQSWISYKLDSRLPTLAAAVVRGLEAIPGRAPLEWVAVCRKRP